MQEFNNILLFGGETKNENMPVGFYSSLALLPLRGKSVILRQLENLKESYGLNKFIIVVCNDIVFNFLGKMIVFCLDTVCK